MNSKAGAEIGERILSVDLGRTSTKACVSRDPQGVVLIPSNTAERPLEDLRRDIFGDPSGDLYDLWLEHDGKGYAVGNLAVDLDAPLGLGEPKTEKALYKVLACVGYFGIRERLNLVLGLPFENQKTFNEQKELLGEVLKGPPPQTSFPHIFKFRGRPWTLEIDQLWIVPEGYGSLILAEHNHGLQGDPYFQQRSVAVMDIGHQTTDFLMVDRLNFARAASKSSEFAMSRFYERVAQKVPGANAESSELMGAVNKPAGSRQFRPKGARAPVDLDLYLPDLRKQFAEEIYEQLIDWLPERAKDVIITGGGGEFFWEELKGFIEEQSMLSAYLTKPSRQANALGQYIYGELQLEALKEARM